jgi:hypothetical protein
MGCAPPARIDLPSDPGTPFVEFAETYKEISSACAGVRTITAELGLSGRAGDERLRGRVHAGFARPSAMRLEAVAAGQVGFILAAPNENAVLYLPREDRVLRKERPEAILAALTGVDLAPSDLQAILTGCVLANGRATSGRRYPNGWVSLELSGPADSTSGGSATLYAQPVDGRWQVRAARRAGWRIDYPAWQGTFPTTVRLLSDNQKIAVDVTATISQLETNLDLEPSTFTVNVPPDALPITLDELRSSGPLRGK